MEEHLPKSTVIFKNWPNLSKKSQSVVVGICLKRLTFCLKNGILEWFLVILALFRSMNLPNTSYILKKVLLVSGKCYSNI